MRQKKRYKKMLQNKTGHTVIENVAGAIGGGQVATLEELTAKVHAFKNIVPVNRKVAGFAVVRFRSGRFGVFAIKTDAVWKEGNFYGDDFVVYDGLYTTTKEALEQLKEIPCKCDRCKQAGLAWDRVFGVALLEEAREREARKKPSSSPNKGPLPQRATSTPGHVEPAVQAPLEDFERVFTDGGPALWFPPDAEFGYIKFEGPIEAYPNDPLKETEALRQTLIAENKEKKNE